MFKVEINERILEILKSTLGETFKLEKYSVYECIANDTEAIKNTYGIYKDSEMSKTFLQQMATQAKTSMIPMIELHNTYGKLPVGRIIDAEVFDNDRGSHDLHVLFLVQSSENPDSLDQRLESGIISSFSSGTSPKKLTCKTCGFDFTASERTTDDLYYDRMCGNKHVVGKDTVVQLQELDTWSELSFVVNGAVPRAKLLSVEDQKLSKKNTLLNLAASSTLGKLQLNTGITGSEPDTKPIRKPIKENTTMSKIEIELSQYNTLVKLEGANERLVSEKQAAETLNVELKSQNEKLIKEKADWETEKVTLSADKETLQTEKTALEEKVTQLEAQLAASNVPEGGKTKNTPDDLKDKGSDLELSFYQTDK